MKRLVIGLAALLVAAPLVAVRAGDPEMVRLTATPPSGPAVAPTSAPVAEPVAKPVAPGDVGPSVPAHVEEGEDSVFSAAASVAWRFVAREYRSETGLVNSVIDYPYATIWDIGSTLAAYYCANALDLLADADFHARTSRALETIAELPLFAGAAFNKNYHVGRGVVAGRNDRESATGYGWSATDLGRLLIWLEIISTAHPRHAPAARRVVERLDLDRIVADGYLWGEDLDSIGQRRRYQEGRLGYEQYAAAGFALWDARADAALDVAANSEGVDVLGVPILADNRQGGHLTSEPFLLMGLETGWWSPSWRDLAEGILAAQQARFEQTGQITIASEDAIPLAPHYFYYYTIHHDGADFPIVALNARGPVDVPRWISTKGAFAWYALDPGPYTWRALQAVSSAGVTERGWSSGIYEESGRPTMGQNINTSAVILEAALYHRLRQPILAAAAGGRAPGR